MRCHTNVRGCFHGVLKRDKKNLLKQQSTSKLTKDEEESDTESDDDEEAYNNGIDPTDQSVTQPEKPMLALDQMYKFMCNDWNTFMKKSMPIVFPKQDTVEDDDEDDEEIDTEIDMDDIQNTYMDLVDMYQ